MAEKNTVEIKFVGKNETKGATQSVQAGLDSINSSAVETNASLEQTNAILGSQAFMEFKDAAVNAFGAATDAAMEFVTAAADGQMVGVRMEATLKALGDRAPTTANKINDLTNELVKLTGFDDDQLVQAQTTLARIGSVSEKNFDRATRAAVDLAAATGMDLNSAFTAVGIAMQNADFGRLARQIGDLPPDMQAAAKAALEMGDTLKAQEIILTGIEQKVGGTGEAIGEGFTGQLNRMRTEYGMWQEEVGIPMINFFTSLPEPVRQAGFSVYALNSTFSPVVSSLADLAIATMGLKAALGAGGLATAASGAAAAIGGGLQAALVGVGGILAAISAPVWLLIAAIGMLIVVIATFGKDAWNTLTMLGQLFEAVFKRMLFEVSKFASGFASYFKGIWASARQIGTNIVQGIWSGIQSGWSWLTAQIGANMDSLLAWVKTKLGIGSPSKVFAEQVGLPMAQGIAAGFAGGMKGVNLSTSATLQPAAVIAGGGSMGGGMAMTGNTFTFYSALTHQERVRVRKEQEQAALNVAERMTGWRRNTR